MKRLKTAVKIIVLVLLGGAICFLLFYAEKTAGVDTGYSYESAGKTVYKKSVDIRSNRIEYGGERYKYNDHLSNYIFMGIDKRELEETQKGAADAGQSDALFLVSMDRMTGRTTLISIPRDTMTMIVAYTTAQNPMLLYDHLSIQYGYGDGRHGSCNLTRDAVSSLMYSLPIQGYCAVSLDALAVMADALGGIEVTIPNDSLAFRDSDFTAGTTVTLDSENTEFFLRVRDTETENSALYRLERQQIFLDALLARVRELYEEDENSVFELYEVLQPYVVSNIESTTYINLMRGMTERDDFLRWTVPGEGVATDTYDEYHVDEDALLSKLLKTMCVKY
ncbi:MAG: LCP family protein [Lachnospiraceae bacterium]|nr:LCP family protein [Lachnospiraceae bacterium]